jgi:hypothetical protein
VGRRRECFRGGGHRQKHCAEILVHALGRENAAGFLPFDDLGMDRFEALVLQSFGGRAGVRA